MLSRPSSMIGLGLYASLYSISAIGEWACLWEVTMPDGFVLCCSGLLSLHVAIWTESAPLAATCTSTYYCRGKSYILYVTC
jgi:hypothetical protein